MVCGLGDGDGVHFASGLWHARLGESCEAAMHAGAATKEQEQESFREHVH